MSDYFWSPYVQLIKLRGNVYCLNHSIKIKLKKIFNNQIHIPTKLMDNLLNRNFLYLKQISEYKEKQELIKKSEANIKSSKFSLLRIMLTDLCNLRCLYCKVVNNVKDVCNYSVKDEKIENVIKFFIKNSVEENPKIVQITGGEPTLFKNKISYIAELVKKYSRKNENIWIVLSTNAVNITQEDAKFYKLNNIKCIVSMDGDKIIHDELRQDINGKGTWNKVNDGIKILKENGVEVSISSVLNSYNIAKFEKTVSWFIESYHPTGLGVNFMKPPTPSQKKFFAMISPKQYAEKIYFVHQKYRNQGLFLELVSRKLRPFVEQKYKFHDCGAAAGTNLNIDAKGNVGPCKSFLVMKKLCLNYLNIQDYRKQILKVWAKKSPINKIECKNCPAIGICGNGCAYDAFVRVGNELCIDQKACKYTKIFFKLFIQDLYEIIEPEMSGENWWMLPTKEHRNQMFGNVKIRENSLSFSIGHHF